MDLETARNYAFAKKGVTEETPFYPDTPVYKVLGKIFLILDVSEPYSANLKAAPENVIELQERYESALPGYHMNKKHWITVEFGHDIPDELFLSWIDDSYNLVVKGLPRSKREQLQ